ncbi:hypothetical protein [Edaphobacter flagellatus]|uniref:hypothetical protein n=1 Tax=Edaphobacter flagellatus TaxID=1933044 RepID=UPI0021B47EEB|nr:hypothetical protein [Edaphobacter flagellatus]
MKTAFLLFLISGFAAAQSVPSPQSHTCTVDNESISDAEIAVMKHEYFIAHRAFQGLTDKDPSNLDAAAKAIETLVAWGHLDDATEDANRLLHAHPQNSIALSTLAGVQWIRGDATTAMTTVSQAMSLDPCNYRALALAARIELAAGQGEAAAKHARMAHQLSPLRVREIWAETRPPDEQPAAYQSIASGIPDKAAERKAHWVANAKQVQLVLADGCTVVAPHPHARVPIHLEVTNLNPNLSLFGMPVELDVKINGHAKTLSLGLGDSIYLSRAAAKDVGLSNWTPLYRHVRLGEESSDTDLVRASSVKIGDLEYRNCPIIIDNEDHYGGGEIPLAFFGDFLTTLDLSALEMTLDPLPAVPDQIKAHWSQVTMDAQEHASINAGPWPNQVAFRPKELSDWMSIYDEGGMPLIPTQIDPVHTRLFLLDIYMPHEQVSTQTAKDAIPVKQYDDSNKQAAKLLGGAEYAMRFGKVIRPINSWVVSSSTYFGGFLGAESLSRARIRLDLRDNLAFIDTPQKK